MQHNWIALLIFLFLESLQGQQDSGCYPVFQIRAATNSLGGTETDAGNSVIQCLLTCVMDASCLGVDIPEDTQACYVHTDSILFANKVYHPDATVKSTQYEMFSRCGIPSSGGTGGNGGGGTPVCTPVLKMTMNTQAFGGVLNLSLTTMSACSDYCSVTPTCYAADFNMNDTTCWIIRDINKFNITQPSPGVVHYYKDTTCTGGSTGGTITSGCPPIFQSLINMGSLGGMKAPGVENIGDCENSCNSNQECLALDFNVNDQPPTCFLHTHAYYINHTYDSNFVVQRRLQQRCADVPSTPAPV